MAVDTIGPLSPDEHGNMYLIVFIDCFSRYACLFPVSDVTGINFAKSLIKYCGHHLIPSTLVSDNGIQFKNHLIGGLTTLLGTNHKFTFAYSKEENGSVERINKEVMCHMRPMRNIIFDIRVEKHWSDYYSLVERIIIAQIHSVTQMSPAQIIYGDTIDLDRAILRQSYESNPSHHIEKIQLFKWTARMLQAQSELIRIDQEHQEEHDMHHTSIHTAEHTEFPINS